MILKAVLKFLGMGLLIAAFLVQQFLLRLLVPREERFLIYAKKSLVFYGGLAQKVLNIKVEFHKSSEKMVPGLIVANHLSYVDILILGTTHPALFITSQEIRETFLLGKICEMAGCFFVERRKHRILPGTKAKEIAVMKKRITEGHSVFLFPEGTSTNGATVLPFKATFFQLAVEAELPVTPLVLNYHAEATEAVPWYGSMTFVDHLFKLCTLRKIEASVKELPKLRGENKFALAETTCQLIRKNYFASSTSSRASNGPNHPIVIPLLD